MQTSHLVDPRADERSDPRDTTEPAPSRIRTSAGDDDPPADDLSQLNRAPVAHLAWYGIRHGVRPFAALNLAHELVVAHGSSRRIDTGAARAMYAQMRDCPSVDPPH